MNTPVLLLIFNRPESTAHVFNQIKIAKPSKLFIAADGPRANNIIDKHNCELVRNLVLNNIDWHCEVQTLFRTENLGCKKAVSSAITWFFNNVEEGIILEDDTVPNNSFFSYMQSALNRFKYEETVMHVTGVNFQSSRNQNIHKNYFSKYPQIWGWGTWKRAWKNYDVLINDWPEFKHSEHFKNWCLHKTEQQYWIQIFDNVYSGNIDTWDYQWIYAMIKNNGLSFVPSNNLVTNIGFNEEATHTKFYDAGFADLPAYQYLFPNNKIQKIQSDKKADNWTFNNIYNKGQIQNIQTPLIKFKNKIRRFSKSFGA